MRRVCWKKGMRLTDELLRASDQCSIQMMSHSFALAAAGRFGLLPSKRPFSLTVNTSKDILDVESLSCLALTKNGQLVDVDYDTRFTGNNDTRVMIPDNHTDVSEYYLTINAELERWKEVNDGYEEPVYSFSLIAVNTPVPDNAIPIGRIVNEYGWRLDELDFVPPCLFVASHPKYEELLQRFSEVLKDVDYKLRTLIRSDSRHAIRVLWPIVQQLSISVDKERDLMTPMALYAYVQKFVSAFTCACELDDYLNLADADTFWNYVSQPYNYQNVYQRIKEGLELCFSINEKIDKMQEEPQQPAGMIEPPTIADSQLLKRCTNSKARVQVTNNAPGANVYYTIDGSEPTQSSMSGLVITIDSGFNNSRKKESDKTVVVKLKAILNGVSSPVRTYEVTLHKDIERWTGIEI